MRVFEGLYPNLMIKDVTKCVLEEGYEIAPRGQPTKEITPAGNIWKEPAKMVLTAPGRRLNPFFTLLESIWILAGRGDSEFIGFYNKNLLQFLDEGYTDYHAPYGRRIRRYGKHKKKIDGTVDRTTPYEMAQGHVGNTIDQFEDCYKLLQRDPDTRQAVIVLWIPFYDNSEIATNDRPCNNLIYFKVRNGSLNMTVCNRSNDLHFGLYTTNVMQFSMMQRVMACLLQLELGFYYHHSDSLHIYHTRDDISERILNATYEFDVYAHVQPYNFLDNDNGVQEWVSMKEFDEDLNTFFAIEDDLRRGDSIKYDAYYLKSRFLDGALHLAKAYMLHKEKKYKDSLLNIFIAYDSGLQDFSISCMEFVMRRYQKPKVAFAEIASTMMIEFLNKYLDEVSVRQIMQYVAMH